MILKALYDYYHRSGDLPPMGFEKKEIYFIIVIKEDGTFVRIEDTREGKNPKSYIVPRGETRTVGIKANLLWDNAEYVLAVPKEITESEKKKLTEEKIAELQKKNEENAKAKHISFVNKCNLIAETMPDVVEFKAICNFYEKGINQIESDENFETLLKERTRNISFQLEYALDIIPSIEAVKEYITTNNDETENANQRFCLVSGKKGALVRLTTSTSIPGSQATASLVSFQKSSGYDSYGKEQCGNAPISEESEAAYVTALKRLTAKDSRNKFYIGNRTFLFWASNTKQQSQDIEDGFLAMLGNVNVDDPNKNIDKVKETMKSVWSGLTATSSNDRFYMLGLAPNSARIAVVYWNECSLKDFAGKILQHFDDMEIVDTRKDKKPYCGIYSLLSAVTLGGKSSDVQPNLPEALLKSIVQGIPYPASLYQACIRRIRAEQQLTITRAAIIKAYLNRLNDINHKKIEIMLDKQNNNPGYLCGRLFATLDKIQEDANHISSIRERYMNAASATPASVFSTLMNLSVHHSEKLNTSKQIYYEKLKQEILDKFNADGFPSHLDLQDQGRFFVGYYHQRQDFFTSKEISTEE